MNKSYDLLYCDDLFGHTYQVYYDVEITVHENYGANADGLYGRTTYELSLGDIDVYCDDTLIKVTDKDLLKEIKMNLDKKIQNDSTEILTALDDL